MNRTIKPKTGILVVSAFLALTLAGCDTPQSCYMFGSFCGVLCAATGFSDPCVNCMTMGASACNGTAALTAESLQQCADNPDECAALLSSATEPYVTDLEE